MGGLAQAHAQHRIAHGKIPRLAARSVPGADAVRGGAVFRRTRGRADWLDPSPRIGLIYDVQGDGRTAIKVGASRYNIGTATGHIDRVNPVSVTSDTRSWRDTNGDLIPQISELGASTGFNFGTTNRYSDDLKRPYSMEYFVEFDRQIARNTVASVGFYYRTNERLIGNRNLSCR